MTERKLIPCPICHGSTKEIQGVLACIANCRTQFYGLAQDKWYVGVQADLDLANLQIANLKTRMEELSNRHLFSIVNPGTKMLGQDITDEMSQAYYSAGENPDDAWRAMWNAADDDVFVNPVSNKILRRAIEIAWERGASRAIWNPQKGVGQPKARPEDIGTVIQCAFEELVREEPDLFKGLELRQFQ